MYLFSQISERQWIPFYFIWHLQFIAIKVTEKYETKHEKALENIDDRIADIIREETYFVSFLYNLWFM